MLEQLGCPIRCKQAVAKQRLDYHWQEFFGTTSFFKCMKLKDFGALFCFATNQAVGGSNPSGRAKQEKAPFVGAFLYFGCSN